MKNKNPFLISGLLVLLIGCSTNGAGPAVDTDDPAFQEARLLYLKGLEFKDNGNRAQALAAFNKVIKIYPNYVTAYRERGRIYHKQGMQEQAEADFNKMIELRPNIALHYNTRGFFYKENGEYNKALRDYNKALKINPDIWQILFNRGSLYLDQKKYRLAEKDFLEVLTYTLPTEAKRTVNSLIIEARREGR